MAAAEYTSKIPSNRILMPNGYVSLIQFEGLCRPSPMDDFHQLARKIANNGLGKANGWYHLFFIELWPSVPKTKTLMQQVTRHKRLAGWGCGLDLACIGAHMRSN